MKGKVIVTMLALLLLMASIGSVSATSNIWYPNDQVEGGVGAHDYDITKDSGPAEDTTFDHDNYLGLSVEADNVKGPEEYGQSDEETNIELFATLTGHSEWYDEWQLDYEYVGGTISTDNVWYHTKPIRLKLEANISYCDESANPSIDWKKSRNKGANVGGEDQPDSYDGFNTPMENTLETSTKIIADETPAGIVMSTENFIDAVREDMSDTKYINEIDGESGDEAHIVQKWDINKNQDDLVYEKRVIDKDDHTKDVGTMNFSASTGLDWDIPATYQDHCTINLKASLLMEHNQDGEITQKWGAVTDSVSFTIKNSKIKSLSNNPDSQDYTTHDGSVTVSTDIGADLIKHRYVDPKLEYLDINWGDNTGWKRVKTDWKPYYYDYNLERFFNRLVETSHEYQVNYGGTHEFTIQVRAKVQDRYGGWEKVGATETISIYYDVGGGGGCPYVSPYNGTKFKRDNNILVQSEFEEGEVTDYYKLDNHLAEHNGNYTLKIEEFENSEDYLNQMKLYTLDHKEGYKVGVTPDGEYLTYKDSDAPTNAHKSDGDDVLKKVDEKNDGKRLEMEAGSEIILDYGDISYWDWRHNKLVLRSSGFSSYTEEDEDHSPSAVMPGPIKTSLYVKLRAGNSDWYNVTTTHPRNNPHDQVIPLEDTLHEMLKDGHRLDEVEVKIRGTKQHNVDYVGLDDSAPTPVKVQEADLLEVMKTDLNGTTTEKTGSLEHDDSNVVNLVPGEECTVTFEAPDRVRGDAFEKRDFILETTGRYEKYE